MQALEGCLSNRGHICWLSIDKASTDNKRVTPVLLAPPAGCGSVPTAIWIRGNHSNEWQCEGPDCQPLWFGVWSACGLTACHKETSKFALLERKSVGLESCGAHRTNTALLQGVRHLLGVALKASPPVCSVMCCEILSPCLHDSCTSAFPLFNATTSAESVRLDQKNVCTLL